MSAESYHCRCGAWVRPEQVVQRNCVALRGIPRFVQVQYRCEACGEVGESLLAYQEPVEGGESPPLDLVCSWPGAGELEGEATALARGPIPVEEVTRFAGAIGRVGAAELAGLRASLRQE